MNQAKQWMRRKASLTAVHMLSLQASLTAVYMLSLQASMAVSVPDKDLIEARRLYRNVQFKEAQALCRKKIAAGSNLPQWHEILAESINLSSAGSVEALNEINIAMSQAPNDKHIMGTAGFIIGANGKDAMQFIPKLQNALKSEPKNGRLHAALSACYESMHNPLAEQEIVEAIKLDPDDFDVNEQAVEHYLKLQKTDEIYKGYARMVKGSPASAYAFTQSGVFARNNYDLKKGAHDLQRATELNPKYGYAYSMWAKCLRKDSQFPEAIKVFTLMIKNGDKSAMVHGRRAYCYAHLKQFENALADYSEAIKIYGRGPAFVPQTTPDPMSRSTRLDYNKFWLERIELRERMGQIDEGINECTTFIKEAKHTDSAYEIRERLYRRKGQNDKALVDLNYLVKKDPDIAEHYTHRAEVLTKLGRAAEAKQDLKHAENIENTGSP